MTDETPGRAKCRCRHRERDHTAAGCSRCWTCRKFNPKRPKRRSVWTTPTAFESNRRRH
jgi:hypothetical protein